MSQYPFGAQYLNPTSAGKNDFKLIYKIRNKEENKYKRIVTKILKMDENNRNDKASTDRLHKKMKKIPTLREFDLLIEAISHEDKIGHLFIVDVEFNTEKEPKRNCYLMNSIHPYLKKRRSSPRQRSVYQLLDAMRLNDQDLLNSYKATSKTHSTMDKKNYTLTR